MKRVAFADESGIDGRANCYSIGAVSVDADRLEAFEEFFKSKLLEHGVQGEAKWTRVRMSHGLINFALDALCSILRSDSASFDVIVVNTSLFRNWTLRLVNQETAFYQTYTYLLRHLASRSKDTADVYIDDRSDSYAKRHEVVEKIGNHMLQKLASKGRLGAVSKVRSREYVGIQIADMLTGAINAAHSLRINPKLPINPGKRLAIERLAEVLGWDDLCYDTMPSDKFNIWHFPIEYRSSPKTQTIKLAEEIRYVSSVDLLKKCQTKSSLPVVAPSLIKSA
jgi:hypothetical protein